EPIFGASVSLESSSSGTATDLDGRFAIGSELINSDKLKLLISSVGYNTVEVDTLIGNGEVDLAIVLIEKIFDLPNVVIESVSMTGGLSGIDYTMGSAHYIGQKEIQKFSYTDINRTLRNIPGVNIQEEDGYGLRPNIGLRASGAERSSKITVMEDGVLAAPAPYAAPSAYYFPTIGRMEAIEILKGSSQIKYGPYTTGGAINLISSPIPMSLGAHADFIAGSNDYRMLHANLGNSHKNVGYLVETMQYSASGFKNLDNGGDTGFNKEDYLAKVRFNTNSDASIYQSLTLKVGQSTENSNETYLGLTDSDFKDTPLRRYAGSQKDNITTKQNQISVRHLVALSSFLDIQTTAYYNSFERNWYKLDKVSGNSIGNVLNNPENYPEELSAIKGESNLEGLLVKANNRSYTSKGIQTNLNFHFNTNEIAHSLEVGLRVHKDEVDRFQWVDNYGIDGGVMKLNIAGRPGTESNRISSAKATATFVQYKFEKGKLMIAPGLRYEHISLSRLDYGKEDPSRTGVSLGERSNTVDVLIPGIAARYQMSTQAKLFGGVHRGFAPPGSQEGAQPEKSWNYELGAAWSNKRWSTQVLAYFNDYSNLLGADFASSGGQGTGTLFNGGEVRAFGVEAEASFDLLSKGSLRLPLSMAYTYSKATFGGSFDSEFEGWGAVEAGDHLPYVPEHQLSLSLSLEHSKWLVDLSGRYSSEMLAIAGSFNELTPRTDAAFTIDFSTNYRITTAISAFVNVNNLLDNVYVVARRPAGVRPNLPRTINVGLKANL
ncbi:MAG: Fe(3+) dicitrate transport protein, partial [Saprospiraceae bacterium]